MPCRCIKYYQNNFRVQAILSGGFRNLKLWPDPRPFASCFKSLCPGLAATDEIIVDHYKSECKLFYKLFQLFYKSMFYKDNFEILDLIARIDKSRLIFLVNMLYNIRKSINT